MRIGMAQLLVEGGEPERNLQRAEKLIRNAAAQKCELVLLPETLDLAWTHPSAFTDAQPIPGKFSDFFCRLAGELKIWLCLGLTELESDKRYNTAILVNDEGKIVYLYRKINLLEVEHPFYETGKSLCVIETPFGNLGVNICSDNYSDSLFNAHMLARMGAQIILSPASWTVDHFLTEETDPYQKKWIKPLSTIAGLYEIPFVSTTSVGYIVGGPYEGKKMVGCSLAVNETGILVKGEFNEFAGDLKVADIQIPKAKWKGTQFGNMLKQKGYKFE
jgi:predicted amidohydrolase